MNIRKATIDDIPFMIEIDHAAATSAHWSEAQYKGLFLPGRFILVAADSEKPQPLGFLVARQLVPEWELENIVVALSARRKGVGRLLLNALLDAARKTNSEAVFLEVRESNAAARSLYESLGFQQSGRRKSYYSNPVEDAVLYRLALR